MNLPAQYRNSLVRELKAAAELMNKTAEPADKLFYFSAAFGETGRILNYHWDKDLALVHIVLQTIYNTINGRVQTMLSGADRTVRLPGEFFHALTIETESLADAVEARNSDTILTILSRLAELSYLSTGNGYYLFSKGALRPEAMRVAER